jgi:hypothetical protein
MYMYILFLLNILSKQGPTPHSVQLFLCMDEEESSMLMPLLSVKCSHVSMGWEKRECLRPGKGLRRLKNGEVDP